MRSFSGQLRGLFSRWTCRGNGVALGVVLAVSGLVGLDALNRPWADDLDIAEPSARDRYQHTVKGSRRQQG